MRATLRLAVALLVVSPGLSCSDGAGPPERIVLIVVDTLRRDALSCYGGASATPSIGALAARGRASASLLASFHQTTMSMGALFTGRTPSLESGEDNRIVGWNGRTWCGLSRLADPAGEPGCIPRSVRTLAELLRDQGYWTAAVVTNPLLFRPAGFDRGFEQWRELSAPAARDGGQPGGKRAPPIGAAAVNRAVREVLAQRRGDRFFLYVHYMDVHDYLLWRRSYASMVRRVDRAVGELLAGLDDEGLGRDTAVILTSDHGEKFSEQHFVKGGFGHRGNPSFEELLRVPLIIAPARFAPREPMVRGQDLFRLIAGIAGVVVDVGAPELQVDELFLSEMHWQTYRSGRWKSYRRRRAGGLRLVDLEADPGETRDVADRFPEIAARHAARMDSLVSSLAAKSPAASSLSDEDRRRLEALGYLE